MQPNIRDFIDNKFYFQANRKQKRLEAYLNHVLGSETMYVAPSTKGEDIVRS